MASDVKRELEQMQTGQYIPTDEEKALLDNKPKREFIGYSTVPIEQYPSTMEDTQATARNTYVGQEAAAAGFGTSRFDRGSFDPYGDLEHNRAIEQSSGSKILNGAAKGIVVAGTTAIETVAGVIDGLIEGGIEFGRQIGEADSISDISLSGVIGKGVNNFTARTMSDIQKLSEEWFPNYRTEEERTDKYQDEWLKHIFTANFIGDSFLKNFGFTVGALAGGAAWSKALSFGLKSLATSNLMKGVVAAAEGSDEAKALLGNALNVVKKGSVQTISDEALAKAYSGAAKSLNKMATKQQLFGGVIAAMGEGTFEGVMARNEFLERRLPELEEEYNSRLSNLEEEFISSPKNSSYVRLVPVVYSDGTKDFIPELNEDGEKKLAEEREKIMLEREGAIRAAEDLGDRVAATTFMWNLPILTVSNVVQFGRMLSGGFDTSRAVAKTTGQIVKQDGKLAAKISAKEATKGATLGKAALYSAKVGATEAAEEMAQGFVSSGAKHIADARLTSYNDDGYDRMVMSELGDWVTGMLDGGMEYLKEGRNWQEGFLGMVTGLLGIPGRTWNGGVAEAYRKAKNDVQGAQAAADALNTLVNSDKFQDAWKGYVRHLKYDAQMEEASMQDDKYSWKIANDKQLVNDIITFANAGRLQDLYDIVDTFAEMPLDDSNGLEVKDAVKGVMNEKDVENNPDKYIGNVKKNAEDIKKGIELYNNMYNSMRTIAPIDASDEQVEEMVAAAMNIKKFEERFLSMFDTVIKSVEPYVNTVVDSEAEGEALSEPERFRRAQSIYTALARAFTTISLPLNADILEELQALPSITNLESLINKTGSTEVKDMVSDMKKLANDREKFIKKLFTLKETSGEEFNKKAQNADKINAQMKKEKIEQEVGNLNDITQIHQGFESTKDRDSFMEGLRVKASEGDKPAKDFVDMYDTRNNFRNLLSQRFPKVTKNRIADIIIDDAFRASNNNSEFLDKLSSGSFDLESVQTTLQRMKDAGIVTDDEILPIMVNQLFNSAVDAINKTVAEFKESSSSTSGHKDIGASEKKESKPIDDNSDPKPTVTPKAPDAKQKEDKKSPVQEAPVSEKEFSEPVKSAPQNEKQSDSYSSSPIDDLPSEQQSYMSDRDGYAKLGYYQQSIPEIAISLMKNVRELLLARKTATKEEMEFIDEQLASMSLPDFVQFNDKGEVIGENENYAKAYKWLKDQGSFQYIATKLSVDDEVVFVKMDSAPLFKGQSPVVVAVVTQRDASGNITEVQPLTFLHQVVRENSDIDYIGLDALYDAIKEDEKKYPVEGGLYVFGGKQNAYTSRVFGKRPGLVRYNRGENAWKPIDKVDDYDSDAPIIVLDESNRPTLLRGKANPDKFYLPNMYSWSSSHVGRVYYMAKNGKDTYIPILLDKVSITSDKLNAAPDGSFLAEVRGVLEKIDIITTSLTADNIKQSNDALATQLKTLNNLMNLDGIDFEYFVDADNVPALDISWKTTEKANGGESSSNYDRILHPGESIVSILDDMNRSPRISWKSKYLASTKKNLSKIIQDGLLTTNAQEMRQAGVNFMFDPWDSKSNSFRRVMISPQSTTNNTVSERTTIARDAEFDAPVDINSAQAPSSYTSLNARPASAPAGLDSILQDAGVVPKFNEYSNFEDLPDNEKKKVGTEDDWNRMSLEERRKKLYCK